MGWPEWICLHVPHASRAIPEEVRRSYLLSEAELERELDRLTDHWVDDLLVPDALTHRMVRAEVSRFVVDVERFADDADEPMAARGMGAVYIRTTAGRPLRAPPEPAERERLLALHYHPHHARLEHTVRTSARDQGHALILDLHSFPAEPLPCDLDQRRPRPDICLGTDPDHTPERLVGALHDAFRDAGFTVGVDRPYAGTIVPLAYYRKDRSVRSVMIEINRRLYMDRATTERRPDFDPTGRTLRRSMLDGIGRWSSGGER